MSAITHYLRPLTFAMQNMFRNIWLTVMTISILVLALFSVSVVIGLNSLSKELLVSVKQKVDISVSLKKDATEEQGRALTERLRGMNEVKSARFVTSKEALEQFRLEHNDDADIQETINLLEVNPLPSRIIIQAKSIESFPSIISFLDQQGNNAIVETTRNDLDQAQLVISRLTKLSDQISRIGLGVTIIFVIISFLVVFNTIRINIYTHREEIGIMKLVGASNWFVRAPYLLEGIMYALLATIITFAILAPVLSILGPRLDSAFFADYGVNILSFFNSHVWSLVIYQCIAAALLNMASCSFAVSRYLKV